ncbi:MAG: transposase [Candidatus Omnitrophica bacterium]|nr:transposase [Candidatus Omnitrophota bacterium]
MSRLKRIYYGNAVYHVIFRGNNRQNILKLKSDKENLFKSIQKYQERMKIKIYGFVLMDNHVHMVMEAGEVHNISKIMQAILLSFSLKYRRKYGYVGHVWQGRFQSKPIMEEKYILECLDYIHCNPVRAGIVSKACDYIYSSAKFYENLKNKDVYQYIELTKYGDTSVVS